MSQQDLRDQRRHNARIKKASLDVGHADLTDEDGAQTFDFAAALPANAIVVGHGIDVTEAFTDGVAGTFTADLGVKSGDTDGFIDGGDLTTAVGKINAPRGVLSPGGLMGAITPSLIVAGSVDVDTATAGALTAYVWYIDGDEANLM